MEDRERRRTKEEMFPLVETWQHSGMSKKAFCVEHGIVKSVFFYWCRRYRDDHEQGNFVQLTAGGPRSFNQSHTIEIQYPNGIVLRLPANTPTSLVRQYIGQ
jgi:transposase-like protein